RANCRTVSAPAGTVIHVPRGTVHSYATVGTTPVRILFLVGPGRHGADVRRNRHSGAAGYPRAPTHLRGRGQAAVRGREVPVRGSWSRNDDLTVRGAHGDGSAPSRTSMCRTPVSASAAGAVEEAEHGGGVEVKHLRTGELSLTHLIQTQYRAVEAFSRGTTSPLSPQHDHLPLVIRGHDAWVHPPLRLSRLQRVPYRAPATRPGLDLRATTRSAVGERWWPMKLELTVVELTQSLLIPSLHRLEGLQHDLNALLRAHDRLLPLRSTIACCPISSASNAPSVRQPHPRWPRHRKPEKSAAAPDLPSPQPAP